MSGPLYPLMAGMLASGYAVAAVFFLRFWTRTADRLFLMFALAFALLAVQAVASVVASQWTDATLWMYLMRLAAYLLIVLAIVDKNLSSTSTRSVSSDSRSPRE